MQEAIDVDEARRLGLLPPAPAKRQEDAPSAISKHPVTNNTIRNPTHDTKLPFQRRRSCHPKSDD